VGKCYQIADARRRKATDQLSEVLMSNGQAIMPVVELVESGQMMLQEFLSIANQLILQAMFEMSVQNLVGVSHRGKRGGDVLRHGHQGGSISLATQKIHVRKPRLRQRKGGEVEVPLYAALRENPELARQVAKSMLHGVSTRSYAEIMPEMAEACGVSKSSISREFVAASAAQLEELQARCLDALDILIVYIDGLIFGGHHAIGAIGVDTQGRKHVLGVVEGATENEVVTVGLLQDLVKRGLDAQRVRLFVIDGSKALRAAITQVFGPQNPVQRCRIHKIHNVLGYLPKDLQKQVKCVMRAAYKLEAKEGMEKLRTHARWLEVEHPGAASSLLEGLNETFTINRLGLPPTLRRCLGTTNIIESSNSGVRQKTKRVTNWKSGDMVLRWAAAAFLETEKNYRRIMGHSQLWILKAALDEIQNEQRPQKIAA
jgi:putative transposase